VFIVQSKEIHLRLAVDSHGHSSLRTFIFFFHLSSSSSPGIHIHLDRLWNYTMQPKLILICYLYFSQVQVFISIWTGHGTMPCDLSLFLFVIHICPSPGIHIHLDKSWNYVMWPKLVYIIIYFTFCSSLGNTHLDRSWSRAEKICSGGIVSHWYTCWHMLLWRKGQVCIVASLHHTCGNHTCGNQYDN